jgi:serine/threonine-protein kinase SRPK3
MTRPISEVSLARSSAPAPPPPPPPPPGQATRRTVFRVPTFDYVEDVQTYRPGGHHPVNLGDVIGRRYRVVHKLGYGGFALVWLALDLHHGQNVALKILRSDAPEHETKVLKYLRDAAPRIPITHLHETFTIRGPNGFHQCLVLDLAGPSLHYMAVYYTDQRPALSFLKVAARRLAEGLAGLHAAGVCHGGKHSLKLRRNSTYKDLDLTNTNVVFEIENIRNWTEEELRRHLGPPKTEPLLFLDGSPAPAFAPAHIVDTLDYSNLDMAKLSPKLLMTDFGEAFFINDPPKALGTPVAFSAPELLFGYPPSCVADLWALGCLLFEIHTFGILLPVFFGTSGEALGMSIETIGALPEAWRGLYHNQDIDLEDKPGKKHRWFDDTIERTRLLDSQIREELPSLSQPQQAALVQLLKSLLVFEPSQRLPAREVGRHPWFTAEP